MATNLARRTRLARLSENLAMLGRYATAARLSNLALNEWEYRRGQTVLRSLPPTLTVDVTNACQLACPLCATGRGDVDRPTRTMPLARFEDLLRQAHERAFQVHLYSWGEPTLVPNLADYVAAVRRRRLGCVFSTNLSRPLKDRKIRDLVAAGPDRIVVSIDGITPETHAQYRVGSDLAVVRDNLARFRSAREARRAAHPMLVWQMLAFRHNQHEIATAEKLHRAWGFDRFELEIPNLPFGAMGESATLPGQWFATDPNYRLDGPVDVKDNIQGLCFWPWRVAVVAPDGKMSTCCYAYDQASDVGDVFADGFEAAWNGPRMTAVRRGLTGQAALQHPCAGCGAARRL